MLTLEGLAPSVGLRHGAWWASTIEFEENGLHFNADPQHGHKTGFYLDQRDNRALARSAADGNTLGA